MKKLTWMTMLLLAGSGLFVSGCAFTRQHMTLKPQIDDFGSSIGAGKEVSVKVVDERDDTTVGHRSIADQGAEITLADNTLDVIKAAIFDSMKKNGFVPIDFNPNAERQLRVNVRTIKHHISSGFATAGLETKVAFGVVAANKGKTYEQLYRAENEQRIVFVPGEDENERYINLVVSQGLQKIHHDPKLMNFLAE